MYYHYYGNSLPKGSKYANGTYFGLFGALGLGFYILATPTSQA